MRFSSGEGSVNTGTRIDWPLVNNDIEKNGIATHRIQGGAFPRQVLQICESQTHGWQGAAKHPAATATAPYAASTSTSGH